MKLVTKKKRSINTNLRKKSKLNYKNLNLKCNFELFNDPDQNYVILSGIMESADILVYQFKKYRVAFNCQLIKPETDLLVAH